MDYMLPGTNSPLFDIPQLAKDGINWITYKDRVLIACGVWGLMHYVNSHAKP